VAQPRIPRNLPPWRLLKPWRTGRACGAGHGSRPGFSLFRRLSLTNTTNGKHFTQTLACPSGSPCQRSSAEVISEAPSNGTSSLPLSNFRAESFTDVVVTNSHGQRGGLRAPGWGTFGVSTENNGGAVLDQPTQIFRGKAFDCYREAAQCAGLQAGGEAPPPGVSR
jgi:hypothetical protein